MQLRVPQDVAHLPETLQLLLGEAHKYSVWKKRMRKESYARVSERVRYFAFCKQHTLIRMSTKAAASANTSTRTSPSNEAANPSDTCPNCFHEGEKCKQIIVVDEQTNLNSWNKAAVTNAPPSDRLAPKVLFYQSSI